MSSEPQPIDYVGTPRASGHVFIAASLDGYIARNDGGIDWLDPFNDTSEDTGYNAFIATVDGLVMGSGSYEKVLTFPTWIYTKPVIVLSRRLTQGQIPDRLQGKVEISALSPAAMLEELARRGWRRAYIDGGKLIQSCLREGLIEDMIVTHVPVLLGSGIPLFGALDRDQILRHKRTIAFPSGLVQSEYAID